MARYTREFGRLGALTCFAAAASMAITPAYAAEAMPTVAPAQGSAFGADFSKVSPYDTGVDHHEADESEYHRRYRRYRRNRIDGGDVLAGVLILGGIAAIASAANNSNERRAREERRRYEERRYDDRRYDDRRDDRRSNPRASDGSGLDNAVSLCLAEIEEDVRVDTVDGASRNASGWTVTGTLFNGSGFACQIDNNGRISGVDYNGFSGVGYDEEAAEGQWSDASYSQARASMGQQSYAAADIRPLTPPASSSSDEPQPAYPGGPLPGEEGYPGG